MGDAEGGLVVPYARRPRTQDLSNFYIKGGARSMRAVGNHLGHPQQNGTGRKGPRWTRAVNGNLVTLLRE